MIDEVRPDAVSTDLVEKSLTGESKGDWIAEGNDVVIPQRSNEDVQVAGISMTLPGDGSTSRVADDGTVVYGTVDGVQLAIQADGKVARVHTVFSDAASVEDVKYLFPDVDPELEEDGSVTLYWTTPDGSIQASVATLAAPLARDADGNPVKTRYRVEGRSVVQELDIAKDTVFPVVSDPAFQGDCGIITCTIRFDRKRTKSIRDYAGDTGKMIANITAVLSAGGGFLLGGPAGATIGGVPEPWQQQSCHFGLMFLANKPEISTKTATVLVSNFQDPLRLQVGEHK